MCSYTFVSTWLAFPICSARQDIDLAVCLLHNMYEQGPANAYDVTKLMLLCTTSASVTNIAFLSQSHKTICHITLCKYNVSGQFDAL